MPRNARGNHSMTSTSSAEESEVDILRERVAFDAKRFGRKAKNSTNYYQCFYCKASKVTSPFCLRRHIFHYCPVVKAMPPSKRPSAEEVVFLLQGNPRKQCQLCCLRGMTESKWGSTGALNKHVRDTHTCAKCHKPFEAKLEGRLYKQRCTKCHVEMDLKVEPGFVVEAMLPPVAPRKSRAERPSRQSPRESRKQEDVDDKDLTEEDQVNQPMQVLVVEPLCPAPAPTPTQVEDPSVDQAITTACWPLPVDTEEADVLFKDHYDVSLDSVPSSPPLEPVIPAPAAEAVAEAEEPLRFLDRPFSYSNPVSTEPEF